MIYIIEGVSCSGKTTFANSFPDNYKRKKLWLNDLDSIKEELETLTDNDVIYDRLFGLSYIEQNDDLKMQELNNYFKSLGSNKYKFIKFYEEDINKLLDNYKKKESYDIRQLPFVKKEIEYQMSGYYKLFSIMDVFLNKEEAEENL